jgi:hypothetical protein
MLAQIVPSVTEILRRMDWYFRALTLAEFFANTHIEAKGREVKGVIFPGCHTSQKCGGVAEACGGGGGGYMTAVDCDSWRQWRIVGCASPFLIFFCLHVI